MAGKLNGVMPPTTPSGGDFRTVPISNRWTAANPPGAISTGPGVGVQSFYARSTNQGTSWTEMLASDPVGATWGPGVRRAPNVTRWGWGQVDVMRQQTPVLMVAGVHDKQVPPERVRELYADYGGAQKAIVDLACSSHNAMWERNHELLFRASLEWLDKGTINGRQSGEFRLGY